MTTFGARYLTATRFALIEQLRNRMAFFLLILFVPAWYALMAMIIDHSPVAFRFRATGAMLQVDGHDLSLITAGFNVITLITGFMLFAATRRDTPFDRRLVLSGYPQPILILAKLTAMVAMALIVSLYTGFILGLYWSFSGFLLIWLGFFAAALAYGALGLLLGVLVRGELEGFFVIIMLSLVDSFLQNPIGNPTANKDIVAAFPAYGPMQIAVAGGFTDVIPWRYFGIALAWGVLFAVLGLAVFTWRTRAWHVHAASQSEVAPADATISPRSSV